MAENPDDILQAADVAEMHQVTEQAVTQALREGRLKGQKPRGTWQIRRADALAWNPRQPRQRP